MWDEEPRVAHLKKPPANESISTRNEGHYLEGGRVPDDQDFHAFSVLGDIRVHGSDLEKSTWTPFTEKSFINKITHVYCKYP